MHNTHRHAFTLRELLVVLGIIALLIGFLLPVLTAARHKARIVACRSNLLILARGLATYVNENKGAYPRTIVGYSLPLAVGSGSAGNDPFARGGPQANDVSAPVWLLLRTQKLPTTRAICPSDEVNHFEADAAAPGPASNFTDYRKNLGYSYRCPYAKPIPMLGGFKAVPIQSMLPLMADLNPGVNPARNADVFADVPGASPAVMRRGNSSNHSQNGQNVLYGDGHVSYEITPLCGINGDNIYTSTDAIPPAVMTQGASHDDAVLLPAGL